MKRRALNAEFTCTLVLLFAGVGSIAADNMLEARSGRWYFADAWVDNRRHGERNGSHQRRPFESGNAFIRGSLSDTWLYSVEPRGGAAFAALI